MSEWVKVAPVSEFATNVPRIAEIDGVRIAVVKLAEGFYAVEDACSHDGGSLGGCVKGTEIACPRHGARFCLKTGEALSAPAYEAIATFPVKIEEGFVFTRDARWD